MSSSKINNGKNIEGVSKKVNRFASIDFMRGFAIWMMIFLHTLMRWVDTEYFRDPANLGNLELFVFFILIFATFFGAWAGFFLLVSSIGNMISMQKSLQRGISARDVAVKQIVGGIILLFFAMLSESTIGYHGALGILAKYGISDKTKADAIHTMLWRYQHYETIHTIAWCIIINGAIYYFMARNGGYKRTKRNIRIFGILALVVIPLTYLAWYIGSFWGDGIWGTDNLWQLTYKFLLNALDREPEPIFPFMSISFIGSIIGIWMLDEKRDRSLIRRWSKWSFIIFMIGLIATFAIIFIDVDALGALLELSWDIPGLQGYGGNTLWLWWFLLLTAAQVAMVLFLLRVVEFRGRAQWFSDRTVYWKRFGFVAFSIYNYEFLDVIPVYLYCLLPWTPDYNGGYVVFGRWEIWIIVFLVYIAWQIALKLWEKVYYVFGIEWMIAKLSNLLIPSKKKIDRSKGLVAGEKMPWYYDPRLDAKMILINSNAVDLVKAEEVDHEHFEDSRLAYKLSLWGILFFPLAIAGYVIAKEAEKTEKPNDYLRKAKSLGGFLTLLTIVITIASCFITLSDIGLNALF